jgi:serine/threonine-protein kinase
MIEIGPMRAVSRRMRGPGRARLAVLAMPLMIAAAAAAVGPSGTALASSTTRLQDVATLFCLDSNTNGNAYTGGCNGGNYQNWALRPVAGYTSDYNIVDAQTGRCLDSNSSGQVYTLTCNGGNYQNWHMTAGSTTTIQNVATLFCLDSNTSGQVYTLSCNGGNFQRWQQF